MPKITKGHGPSDRLFDPALSDQGDEQLQQDVQDERGEESAQDDAGRDDSRQDGERVTFGAKPRKRAAAGAGRQRDVSEDRR